jgi:hypothetical protein
MIWLFQPLSGNGYQFWSGIGSDFSEIAIIGAVIATYKHHNCAVPRCPRIAHRKYEIKETKQYTCRHHHTQYWHDLLVGQYKEDYPEQHAFINKDEYEK